MVREKLNEFKPLNTINMVWNDKLLYHMVEIKRRLTIELQSVKNRASIPLLRISNENQNTWKR